MTQKAKKRSKLRHAEYYDMQNIFDELYAKSRDGEIFNLNYSRRYKLA